MKNDISCPCSDAVYQLSAVAATASPRNRFEQRATSKTSEATQTSPGPGQFSPDSEHNQMVSRPHPFVLHHTSRLHQMETGSCTGTKRAPTEGGVTSSLAMKASPSSPSVLTKINTGCARVQLFLIHHTSSRPCQRTTARHAWRRAVNIRLPYEQPAMFRTRTKDDRNTIATNEARWQANLLGPR